MTDITRRSLLGGMAGASGLYASGALGQSAKLPTGPVALNIIDVAGNLQLTQAAIERFARENPKIVSRVTFSPRALAGTARQSSRRSSRPTRSTSTWC